MIGLTAVPSSMSGRGIQGHLAAHPEAIEERRRGLLAMASEGFIAGCRSLMTADLTDPAPGHAVGRAEYSLWSLRRQERASARPFSQIPQSWGRVSQRARPSTTQNSELISLAPLRVGCASRPRSFVGEVDDFHRRRRHRGGWPRGAWPALLRCQPALESSSSAHRHSRTDRPGL